MYDEIEKEKLTTAEFLALMILCFALCIIGYIIGKVILAAIGG